MKNNKIIIFIVAILVLAGAGVVLVNKNKVPVVAPATTTKPADLTPIVPVARVSTEGWKTCRNEEYGYEFKYPEEFKIINNYREGDIWKSEELNQCPEELAVHLESPKIFEVVNPPPSEGYIQEKTTKCIPQITVAFTPHDKIIEWTNNEQVADEQSIIEIAARYSNVIDREYLVDSKRGFVFNGSENAPCQPVSGVEFAHNKGYLNIESIGVPQRILETTLSTFRFLK